MQNSDGFIFRMTNGQPRFVGDNDVVYDWFLGRWRRACTIESGARVSARVTMMSVLRAQGRPFYRARMIR